MDFHNCVVRYVRRHENEIFVRRANFQLCFIHTILFAKVKSSSFNNEFNCYNYRYQPFHNNTNQQRKERPSEEVQSVLLLSTSVLRCCAGCDWCAGCAREAEGSIVPLVSRPARQSPPPPHYTHTILAVVSVVVCIFVKSLILLRNTL